MAAAGGGFDSSEKGNLDALSREIEILFNCLHDMLEVKKFELLELVKDLYQKYSYLDESISQLEYVIRSTITILTENRIFDEKEQGIRIWEEKITELRMEKLNLGSLSELKLVYNNDKFIDSVATIRLTNWALPDGSVIFAKIDLDHQYGMAWPSVAYKKFREKSGSLFGETLVEIDTSGISTRQGFDSKVSKYLPETKSENIFIIILGFSAFGR